MLGMVVLTLERDKGSRAPVWSLLDEATKGSSILQIGGAVIPIYDYTCPSCGRVGGLLRGYEDYTISCPQCGGTAERIPVYREQSVIFKGGGFTKSVIPPRPTTDEQKWEVQEEMGKELKKRDWSYDRTIQEMRDNKFEDETGAMRIDTTKMTKEA